MQVLNLIMMPLKNLLLPAGRMVYTAMAAACCKIGLAFFVQDGENFNNKGTFTSPLRFFNKVCFLILRIMPCLVRVRVHFSDPLVII